MPAITASIAKTISPAILAKRLNKNSTSDILFLLCLAPLLAPRNALFFHPCCIWFLWPLCRRNNSHSDTKNACTKTQNTRASKWLPRFNDLPLFFRRNEKIPPSHSFRVLRGIIYDYE